jgi:CIC family chloride channel protein
LKRRIGEEFKEKMSEYEKLNRERWTLFPRAALIGLVGGLVAVAFRVALEAGAARRMALSEWSQKHLWFGFLLSVAVTLAAVGGAVWLVRRFAPETAGSGIPHIKAVLAGNANLRDLRVLLVKFASGVIGIAGGLALGREGPTIQMCAAVGQRISKLWKVDSPEYRESLIICGCAAGLSAAFNAPLAAVVFALEELEVTFTHGALFAAVVASLVADMVVRLTIGELPVFQIRVSVVPSAGQLHYFLAIGIVGGLVGVLFTRMLILTLARVRAADRSKWRVFFAAVVVLIGLVGVVEPRAIGGGLILTDNLLDNRIPLWPVVSFFALRFLLTVVSYSLDTAGGIFAPLLLVGGLLGNALGALAAKAHLVHSPDPVVWTITGMVSIFSAVVRCPLTAIVLLVEMTGYYPLVLPLLCASFVAAGVADLFGIEPVYDLLGRIGRHGESIQIEQVVVDSTTDSARA